MHVASIKIETISYVNLIIKSISHGLWVIVYESFNGPYNDQQTCDAIFYENKIGKYFVISQKTLVDERWSRGNRQNLNFKLFNFESVKRLK